MRVPYVRLTVRRMMIAVAAVALLMFAVDCVRRSSVYRHQADLYALAEDHALWVAHKTEEVERYWQDHPEKRAEAMSRLYHWHGPEPARKLAAYHARLKRKYHRAMWRPWEAVEPDPPFPQSP
jgi:hypothetical protein